MTTNINCQPRMSALAAAIVLLGSVVGATAHAATYTFSVDGTAGDGRPNQATALMEFSGTSLKITLTNDLNGTQDPPGWGISSQLTGFDFTVANLTSVTLDSVTVTGVVYNGIADVKVVDCTGGIIACTNVTGTSQDIGSPYGWGVSNSPSAQGKDWQLAAGDAGSPSYKPFGIVNATVRGDTDGMKSAEHNPLLMGPVEFAFTINDFGEDMPDRGEIDVGFYFGTAPDYQAVPIPAAAWLFGSGLIGLVGIARRRRAG